MSSLAFTGILAGGLDRDRDTDSDLRGSACASGAAGGGAGAGGAGAGVAGAGGAGAGGAGAGCAGAGEGPLALVASGGVGGFALEVVDGACGNAGACGTGGCTGGTA